MTVCRRRCDETAKLFSCRHMCRDSTDARSVVFSINLGNLVNKMCVCLFPDCTSRKLMCFHKITIDGRHAHYATMQGTIFSQTNCAGTGTSPTFNSNFNDEIDFGNVDLGLHMMSDAKGSRNVRLFRNTHAARENTKLLFVCEHAKNWMRELVAMMEKFVVASRLCRNSMAAVAKNCC